MRKLIVLMSLILMIAVVPAFAQDDMMEKTIVEIAVEAASADMDAEFTTLVAAVVAADLVEALSGEGPFTVFAPTDEAFAAALEALDLTAEELLADTETLTSVLLYHVVPAEVSAEAVMELDGEYAETLLEGDKILIRASEDGVTVDGANVIATDIMGSNGIIHVIDAVILPDGDPTIVDIAVEAASAEMDAEFTTLVAAVIAADLVEALSDEGPFTVFAPTDEAFAAALEALGLTAEELLADTETLTSVLLYHVVPGKVLAKDVVELDGETVETLLEDDGIMISVSEDGVMVDGANVIATDIIGSNGVIHVIDAVILPDGE